VNHILTQDHGLKVAVIENEFGEVRPLPPTTHMFDASAGWYLLRNISRPLRDQLCFSAQVGIDDALVRQKFDTDEEIFEMNNGCICCTVKAAPQARRPLALPTVHLSSPI
jgi:G3E family GTPase